MSKPQLIEELMEVLQGCGYEGPEAEKILDVLCGYLGGRQVYFPRSAHGNEAFHEERDRELWEFVDSGVEVSELVVKFGMSEGAIYRAVKRHKGRRHEACLEPEPGGLF